MVVRIPAGEDPGIRANPASRGAFYILWLAWHTLRASYNFEAEGQTPLGFLQGFLLQVLNVKVIVYALTLYGTVLVGKITSPVVLLLSAIAFATVGFSSLSVWTLFGTGIRKYLDQVWVKRVLNIILALLLVYTAVDLSGVLDRLS
ncbi:MAG: LysE family translocator [Brevefilum sp.]